MREEITSFYQFPDERAARHAARVLANVFRDGFPWGDGDEDADGPLDDPDDDEANIAVEEAAERVCGVLDELAEGVTYEGVGLEGSTVALTLSIHDSVDSTLGEEDDDEDRPRSRDLQDALAGLAVALGGADPRLWPLPPAGWRERVPSVADLVIEGFASTARARPAGPGTAVIAFSQAVMEDVLENVLRAAVARGACRLALDLSAVRMFPADGAETLATAQAHARAQGGDLALFGVPPDVRARLDLSPPPEPFAIARGEAEALARLRAGAQ